MVPICSVAEGVAIKTGMTEIVQAVEILRCELIMSELVVAKLIVSELVSCPVYLIVRGKRVVTGVLVAGNSPSIARHSVTVTDIVGSDVMAAGAHGVAGNMPVEGVSRAQAMATPPMTNATMSSKPMVSTASAMPAAAVKSGKSTAPALIATASTPTAMPAATATPASVSARDCRDVRDETKRANCNARCQNAYRPLHGALSLTEFGSNAREPTHLNVTVVSAGSFLDFEAKVPC
jgi:hypothetical protein